VASGPAPDLFDAILGWRVWDVVDCDGALRLSSPGFQTVWLPQRETIADCRRSGSNLTLLSLPDHGAPSASCRCGIYATRTAQQSVPYFTHLFLRGRGVLQRLIGTVSLWGTVVECTSGWRASHAYPAHLYLPAPSVHWVSFLGGLPQSLRPVEEIAVGLAEYGVPIELLNVTTPRGLVAMLRRASIGSLQAQEEDL
jgi:hypothetical protein